METAEIIPRSMSRSICLVKVLCGVVLLAVVIPEILLGTELVNLTIRSDKREYSYPDNPPAPIREKAFSIPGPGRIRIYYYQSVFYKESVGGGASFYGMPGPRFGSWSWDLGHKGLSRTDDPVKPIDRKPFTRIDIVRVDAPVKGLIARLMPVIRGELAAGKGIQYELFQQLIVEFIGGAGEFPPLPTQTAQSVPGPNPVRTFDIAGTWTIQGSGAPGKLEITKRGTGYSARYFGGWNAWETILDFTFNPATGRFSGKRPVRPGSAEIIQIWEGTLIDAATLRGVSRYPNNPTRSDGWSGKKIGGT